MTKVMKTVRPLVHDASVVSGTHILLHNLRVTSPLVIIPRNKTERDGKKH